MFADLLVHTAAFVEGGDRSSLVFVSHQSVLAKESWPVVAHEHTIKHLKRKKVISEEVARKLKQSKPRIQPGAIINRSQILQLSKVIEQCKQPMKSCIDIMNL